MGLDDYSAGVEVGPGGAGPSPDGGPSEGLVGRWGAVVMVIGGAGAGETMAALRDGLGEEPSSGDVVDLLRADPRFGGGSVDLAAAISTPDGLRIFVRGRAEARTEANERVDGAEPVERDLPGARAVWLGLGGPPSRQAHPVIDLRRGIVPGRGLVLYRTTAAPGRSAPAAPAVRPALADPQPPAAPAAPVVPPAPTVPPAPVVPPPPEPPTPPPAQATDPGPGPAERAPSEVRPFAALDWSAPAETRQPLPLADAADGVADVRVSAEQVLGIRCSRNHFNHPRAGYCQVCGISMVHLTHRLEPGPRPTLGFVVFADGATYALDRSYLIGRRPRPASASGLTPIAAQDATQSVSREHGELHLDGWEVHYVDRGSTNGSFVWEADRKAWRRLETGTPLVLASGMTVSVGRMTFVFQAASKAVEGR